MNVVHVLYCIARKEALSTSTYCYASRQKNWEKLKCLRDEKEKATSCVQCNCNIVLLQEVLK